MFREGPLTVVSMPQASNTRGLLHLCPLCGGKGSLSRQRVVTNIRSDNSTSKQIMWKMYVCFWNQPPFLQNVTPSYCPKFKKNLSFFPISWAKNPVLTLLTVRSTFKLSLQSIVSESGVAWNHFSLRKNALACAYVVPHTRLFWTLFIFSVVVWGGWTVKRQSLVRGPFVS